MPRLRRLSRLLLNAATVVSLVLCVAAVALWVRSFYVQDALSLSHGQMDGVTYRSTQYKLYCVRGHNVLQSFARLHQPPAARLLFEAERDPHRAGLRWSRQPTNQFAFNYNPDVRGRPLLVRLGFRFSTRMHDSTPPDRGYAEARVPHWFLVALTAILPARSLWTARRRRVRRRAGLCPACGYDLRATPDRCPECGTIPAL